MDHDLPHKNLRNNPLFVISVALVLAIIMVAISTYMYLRSDTRVIVEQIQENNNELGNVKTDQNIVGEFSTEMIDAIESKIHDDITNLSTDADYNPDEITDAALGL